jgi:hypothetical protein
MRTRASVVLVVLALCATASTAYAGGPGAVYTDFARDGKLSCNHSRADLEAALRSGTLNQYGDPLTLGRMKLAVRKHLAGGCTQQGTTSTQGGSFLAGRGLVIGLLAVAVALGGWLTKHALSARR